MFTPGRKSLRWLTGGLAIGMVLSTLLWYWILPVRTQHVMMFKLVNIMWYLLYAGIAWALFYFVVPMLLRVAFMENFEVTKDEAPRHRADKGRIKLLQPLIKDQITRSALKLEEAYSAEQAITWKASVDRNRTAELLEQLKAAEHYKSGAKWNYDVSVWLAWFMGFEVLDNYRDYVRESRV